MGVFKCSRNFPGLVVYLLEVDNSNIILNFWSKCTYGSSSKSFFGMGSVYLGWL